MISDHSHVALFTIQNEFRYEIVRKIFEGGMGVVYEAEQHGTRGFVKRVAIKVIRPNFGSQKMFMDNFVGEAKLVADLIHTNIVQTYHLGEVDLPVLKGWRREVFGADAVDLIEGRVSLALAGEQARLIPVTPAT